MSMRKKFKSKWFRIAVEGDTTDGRAIQRDWIEQMAANFNPEKYGARIWLEHIRGITPDSAFKAYGDITAVKAEEVTIDGEKKLALMGQIDPTEDLVQMNKKRQKIYSSVEIDTNFAKSGEAYLVGLGITDSPASLGTSVLEFSAKNPEANPYKERKQRPENLFSASSEIALEFDEQEDPGESLLDRVKEMFSKKSRTDSARFSDVEQAIEEIAGNAVKTDGKFSSQIAEFEKKFGALESELKEAREEVKALENKIDHTENKDPKRPPAAGGNGQVLTDC